MTARLVLLVLPLLLLTGCDDSNKSVRSSGKPYVWFPLLLVAGALVFFVSYKGTRLALPWLRARRVQR